jgi:Ran GTPase-activating protein (RanGAP) involved in mRNA processing and transport
MNICSNNLGQAGAHEVAKMLCVNTSLRTINLSWNGLGSLGMHAIAENMLTSSCFALQHLDVSLNILGENGTLALARLLARNESFPNLLSLNARGNDMHAVGGEAMGAALASNTSLTCLNMSNNALGSAGTWHIARGLNSNTSLRHLGLASNSFGHEGAGSISAALIGSTQLCTLNVAHNGIGDDGAVAIAHAIARQRCLRSLDISSRHIARSHGCISEKGSLAIGKALVDAPRPFPLMVLGVNLRLVGADLHALPPEARHWHDREISTYLHGSHMSKALGFAMGQHARIGADSLVHLLSDDVVPLIFAAYFGSAPKVLQHAHHANQDDRCKCPWCPTSK